MNDETRKALAAWHAATDAAEKARKVAEDATKSEWMQRIMDAGILPHDIIERPEYADGPLRRFVWDGGINTSINYFESVFTPMATGEWVRKDGRSYHPPRLAYVPADRLIIEGGVI